jgi:serine/threonine protein kinase
VSLVGDALPRVPLQILDNLKITDIINRYWFWVGRNQDSFYKLAPKDSVGLSRVRSEAMILRRLHHPNVVRGGQLIETRDWEILKLDAVDGQPVSLLRDRLSSDEKARVLADIEAAIAYVNDERILHTDISASNAIWDGSRAYLIDFGDAKRLRSRIRREDSPDFVGGPPCSWGDVGDGCKTYLCFRSLCRWLWQPEFVILK